MPDAGAEIIWSPVGDALVRTTDLRAWPPPRFFVSASAACSPVLAEQPAQVVGLGTITKVGSLLQA